MPYKKKKKNKKKRKKKKKNRKKKKKKKKKRSEWGEKRFLSGQGLRNLLGVLITFKNHSGEGRPFWTLLRFVSRLGILVRTQSLSLSIFVELKYGQFFFSACTLHFQIMMDERTAKCVFKVNLYFENEFCWSFLHNNMVSSFWQIG
jgi:hypothetical protein